MQSIEQSLIETAVDRGHGPFRRRGVTVLGRRVNDYTCTRCNMEARADRNPPANGIDIGGALVALACTKPSTTVFHDCPNCGGHDE